MTYGEHLRNIRESLGLSQAQLARLAGIETSACSCYEGNKHEPSPGAAYRIRQALESWCNATGQAMPKLELPSVLRQRNLLREKRRAARALPPRPELAAAYARCLYKPAKQRQPLTLEGEAIRIKRLHLGITQKQLAEAAKVSETVVSQYEIGIYKNPETIKKIQDALERCTPCDHRLPNNICQDVEMLPRSSDEIIALIEEALSR